MTYDLLFSFFSPIWNQVTHKGNVFVVCPKGAGHFKHPVEAVISLRAGGKLSDDIACTLIIRLVILLCLTNCK